MVLDYAREIAFNMRDKLAERLPQVFPSELKIIRSMKNIFDPKFSIVFEFDAKNYELTINFRLNDARYDVERKVGGEVNWTIVELKEMEKRELLISNGVTVWMEEDDFDPDGVLEVAFRFLMENLEEFATGKIPVPIPLSKRNIEIIGKNKQKVIHHDITVAVKPLPTFDLAQVMQTVEDLLHSTPIEGIRITNIQSIIQDKAMGLEIERNMERYKMYIIFDLYRQIEQGRNFVYCKMVWEIHQNILSLGWTLITEFGVAIGMEEGSYNPTDMGIACFSALRDELIALSLDELTEPRPYLTKISSMTCIKCRHAGNVKGSVQLIKCSKCGYKIIKIWGK